MRTVTLGVLDCVLDYSSLWPQIIQQWPLQSMRFLKAYGTNEGRKGEMEAGTEGRTDKLILSSSHLIR